MTELVKSLLVVQKELKAPKNQNNTFGKYKYRSAEDILEAVKPLNVANGLLLTLSDEPMLIGDWHYIKATATITNGKETSQVTAYAREPLDKKGADASQITGTASSYARKYALNGLYLIDDTKDADTDEYQQQGNKQAPKQQQTNSNLISEAQTKMLDSKLKNTAVKHSKSQAEVFTGSSKHLGISNEKSKLTKAEASKIIEYLTKLEG